MGFRHQQTVRTVVNDVSLQIEAGETLALVGESGSGKSVTALSILRLLPSPPVEYLSGDIRFHGESLLHASDQTLRGVRGNKIAMIFQEPDGVVKSIAYPGSSFMKCFHSTAGCVGSGSWRNS